MAERCNAEAPLEINPPWTCDLEAGHTGSHTNGLMVWERLDSPPVMPALGKAKARTEAPGPSATLDLIDAPWLRGAARYLREQAAMVPAHESTLIGKALRFERLASEVEWAIGFVDGLEETNPGVANEIAQRAGRTP